MPCTWPCAVRDCHVWAGAACRQAVCPSLFPCARGNLPEADLLVGPHHHFAWGFRSPDRSSGDPYTDFHSIVECRCLHCWAPFPPSHRSSCPRVRGARRLPCLAAQCGWARWNNPSDFAIGTRGGDVCLRSCLVFVVCPWRLSCQAPACWSAPTARARGTCDTDFEKRAWQ